MSGNPHRTQLRDFRLYAHHPNRPISARTLAVSTTERTQSAGNERKHRLPLQNKQTVKQDIQKKRQLKETKTTSATTTISSSSSSSLSVVQPTTKEVIDVDAENDSDYITNSRPFLPLPPIVNSNWALQVQNQCITKFFAPLKEGESYIQDQKTNKINFSHRKQKYSGSKVTISKKAYTLDKDWQAIALEYLHSAQARAFICTEYDEVNDYLFIFCI